ncbi:MAG: putative DNA binding domain-containing protein [Anaerolineales bacterium]|nr:MAG: putative DNA binding domain-containing protein [Anaerolineales bacterium]
MGKKKTRAKMHWRLIDLHLHTPASGDYQQPEASYLEVLQRAEARGLDVIAFTDHNTIAGYRRMQEEIHQLELLEKLNRLMPDERARLTEYRRILGKMLVLPGFELTATFGFHILAIFPPEKSVRDIEHLLISLNIPTEKLDEGSALIGASSDVLTAYRLINQAGGLVIAAHANSSNGVAMRGFPLGGQTKIAYTQDPNLHALEVTDLEVKGRRSTATFFSGTKPEYPRRMHCIQGSDAHRLKVDPQRKKNLGVGDRVTEVLLPETSFEALLELFLSNDFARTRPQRPIEEPAFDFVQAAREEGSNIVQDFHDGMSVRGGKRYAIIADVCAFANANGGTLYVGLSSDPKNQIAGIQNPEGSVAQLEKEINDRISPPLQCTLDVHETAGKNVIRILIPRGDDPPYAVDDNKIYVRSEADTGLAVRDEIVDLVMRGLPQPAAKADQIEGPAAQLGEPVEPVSMEEVVKQPPRTGVEIVSVEERSGGSYYTVRDLRNGNVVKNVTQKSARRLWHYAITSFSQYPDNLAKANVNWEGELGLVKRWKQGKSVRYDLVQRVNSDYRYYFGVTDDGIHGPWEKLVGREDE